MNADRALTDLRFPADVGSENSVVLRRGTIEVTDDELVVRRGGRILAQTPFATVRARRTRLSLGSAVRMRVGDVKLALEALFDALNARGADVGRHRP